MIISLIIIFGTAGGFIAHYFLGSKFGLWRNICLGVAGATFASVVVTLSYMTNLISKRDIIGINSYSIAIEIIGAIIFIYGGWFYKTINKNTNQKIPSGRMGLIIKKVGILQKGKLATI